MKNALRYLGLWQKKRNELKVDDDPQKDWLDMRALLDEHMPVEESDGGGGSSFFKGLKLLPTLFIAVSAAAMIYTASHIIIAQKHKHALALHHRKHKRYRGDDSTAYAFADDSLSAEDSVADKHDSLDEIQQATGEQNIAANKPGPGTISAKQLKAIELNKAATASSKKDNQVAINGGSKDQGATISHHNNTLGQSLLPNHNLTRQGTSSSLHGNGNGSLVGSNANSFSSRIQGLGGANNQGGVNGSSQSNLLSAADNERNLLIPLSPPRWDSNPGIGGGAFSLITPVKQNNMSRGAVITQVKNSQKDKAPKIKGPTSSSIDWGVFVGANTQGGLKLPADLYFGPYATYNINNKLGLNLQLRISSSQGVTGSYSHTNGSKVDSGQNTFLITDSRKIYSLEVPLYIEYKATKNIGFKAGPVFSIPLRLGSGKNTLGLDSIRHDTSYYNNITGLLSKTRYQPKLNYGFSAGVSFHVDRFIFDATWLKRFNDQKITSDLGSYNANSNTFQFTIGFKLNKSGP